MEAECEDDELAQQAIQKMKDCLEGDSGEKVDDDKVDEYVAEQHAVQEMLKENTETQRQAELHYQQKAKTKSAANKRDGETPADGDTDAPTNGATGAPAAASPPKKKRGRGPPETPSEGGESGVAGRVGARKNRGTRAPSEFREEPSTFLAQSSARFGDQRGVTFAKPKEKRHYTYRDDNTIESLTVTTRAAKG
ncbi:hypothetical protein SO694_00038029 [Aureococcus anophagefferens]|uniref:Uncharacterized protein n=1 Tax=Aureococcus anophagefferens TaxID=44056 RepID=A0ABR1FLT2_AURAN